MLGLLGAFREGDRGAGFHFDARGGDGFAGQDGVDGFRGFGDGAVVGDLEAGFRSDDEDFAFAGDAELFADELEFIHQDGEGELLGFRLGGRGVARVLRVDGVEEDALVLVGGLQLGELGSGFTRNLAAIDLAHQDDGRGALEVVEFVSETVRVRQLEVGGAFRHGRDRRGRGRSRNG